MFLDSQGNVDNQKAGLAHNHPGVPGTVAGLIHALDKYGSMSIKEVIKAAIKLASQGFPINHDLSDSLRLRSERLHKHKASKKYFYKANGDNFLPGEILVQHDLSQTLARISEQGDRVSTQVKPPI